MSAVLMFGMIALIFYVIYEAMIDEEREKDEKYGRLLKKNKRHNDRS